MNEPVQVRLGGFESDGTNKRNESINMTPDLAVAYFVVTRCDSAAHRISEVFSFPQDFGMV
jgi:hypothetical protein